MSDNNSTQIIQIVRFKTKMSKEELLKVAKKREPEFKAISGIVQKYYVSLGPEGEYGGIYVWDSMESLNAFRESKLAKSIPKAYQVIEGPSFELMSLLFPLRK